MASCYFHPNFEIYKNCQRCKKPICQEDAKEYTRHVEKSMAMLYGQSNYRGYSLDFTLCPICYVELLKDENAAFKYYALAAPVVLIVIAIWELVTSSLFVTYIVLIIVIVVGSVKARRYLMYVKARNELNELLRLKS